MKHMIIAMLLLLSCAMSATAVAEPGSPDRSGPTLRQTLDRHLAAINARDLDALMATVTVHPELTTILPNGAVLETREQYRQLHVEWFAGTDWRMVFEVQDVADFGDMGIARVRYDSQKKDAAGDYHSNRIALLTLVFAKEDSRWRLVYDQNTVVPAATH